MKAVRYYIFGYISMQEIIFQGRCFVPHPKYPYLTNHSNPLSFEVLKSLPKLWFLAHEFMLGKTAFIWPTIPSKLVINDQQISWKRNGLLTLTIRTTSGYAASVRTPRSDVM